MLLNYNNFTQDDLSVWPERSNVNIHSKTKQQYRYFNSFHQPVCNTFFGGYPNPCCCQCVIFLSDDFDRVIIGPSWDIRAGAWAISGNRLVETGTLNALIITSGDINSLDEVQYVSVDISGAQSGSCHKVIVNYLDDDNYHSVSLSLESEHHESGLVKLMEYIGGVSNQLNSRWYKLDNSSGVITITAHFNPQIFCGAVEPVELGTNGPIWTTDHTTIVDGLKAGLGNCSYHQKPVIYDNFLFEDEWYRDGRCPKCGCFCEYSALPDTLALTCYGDGQCSGFNGATFNLKWDYEMSNWQGIGNEAGSGYCKLYPPAFVFSCTSQTGASPFGGSCSGFTLSVEPGGGAGCITEFNQSLTSCSCNPLIFTYAPNLVSPTIFSCSCCCPEDTGGDTCGSFYFEVTETI